MLTSIVATQKVVRRSFYWTYLIAGCWIVGCCQCHRWVPQNYPALEEATYWTALAAVVQKLPRGVPLESPFGHLIVRLERAGTAMDHWTSPFFQNFSLFLLLTAIHCCTFYLFRKLLMHKSQKSLFLSAGCCIFTGFLYSLCDFLIHIITQVKVSTFASSLVTK